MFEPQLPPGVGRGLSVDFPAEQAGSAVRLAEGHVDRLLAGLLSGSGGGPGQVQHWPHRGHRQVYPEGRKCGD